LLVLVRLCNAVIAETLVMILVMEGSSPTRTY
jgi:hypothetical protein